MLNFKKLLIQLIKQFLSKIYLYFMTLLVSLTKRDAAITELATNMVFFLGIYNKMSRVSFYLLLYIYIGNAGTELFYNNLNPLI